MGLKKEVSPGDRIAHRSLDDQTGGAKTGVAKEVIGDQESGMVIAEFDDTAVEGYDQRELVSLGKATRSSGPVVLKPRHLLALSRKLPVLIALVVAIAIAVGLNVLARVEDWPTASTLVVSVGSIIFAFVVFTLAEMYVSRSNRRRS